MSTNAFVFMIFLLLSTSGDNKKAYDLIIKDYRVDLMITRSATRKDLRVIASRLIKEKNIRVDFNELVISKGKIDQIKMIVDCQDGFAGSFGGKLSGNDQIGFYRIYGELISDSISPFQVGKYPLYSHD